jgi:hypothetical protein
MNRTLKDLDKLQQLFIDAVYIQQKKYSQVVDLLKIDLAKLRDLNKELEIHWRPLLLIRNKWKNKKIGGDFWDFCHWYISTEKRCHYCKITQDELDKLYAIGIINKRATRGKHLEIERKIANENYANLDNLTYSCYWCNNAKTDTFTEEEFKIIGEAIRTVWKQRLNKNRI